MDQTQSMDNDLSSIEGVIKSLIVNKHNPRLLVLDLTILTQYLRKNKAKAANNAVGMLKKRIIEFSNELLQNQITTHSEDSKEIAFGIGKLLYYILLSIKDEKIKEYDERMALFAKTNNGLVLIMNFIKEILSNDNLNTLFIFLGSYQSVLKWINKNYQNEFEGYLTFLFALLDGNDLSANTINLIVSNIHGLLIEYNQSATEKMANSSFFVSNLCSIISNLKNEETIIRSLDILDTISKSNEGCCCNFFDTIDLFKLIDDIRASNMFNNRIALYFKAVLAQLMNQYDLECVINALSNNNTRIINNEGNDYLMMKYSKQASASNMLILTEYIVKESKFVSELNIMNSIKVFYGLLVEEIKGIKIAKESKEEMKYDTVSRILLIITSLTIDYDFSLTESNENILHQLIEEVFKAIAYCTNIANASFSFPFLLVDFLLSQPSKLFNASLSSIDTVIIENAILFLLRNYYNRQWAIDCINRIELSVIYKAKYNTLDDFYKDKSKLILSQLGNGSKEISNIAKDNIDLILTQLMKKQQDDEVIQQTTANELFTIIDKVVNILYANQIKEDSNYPNESQSTLILCFVFSLIEVKIADEETYNNINRSEALFILINSLIINQTSALPSSSSTFNIFYYTSIRLNYLSMDRKLNQRFNTLLLNEYLCDYIYHSLTIIDNETNQTQNQDQDKAQDLQMFCYNILLLLKQMIQSPNQFSKFLSLEGIELLFKLISNRLIFNNKAIQVLTDIISYISMQYLTIVTSFYNEEWLFESLISHVSNIKLSLGINNPLVFQMLFLLKEIMINSNRINSQVIKDSNLIAYLIKELISLYPYYSNAKDNCFLLVLSILSNLSGNAELAHLFLDQSLIDIIHITFLNELNLNDSMFNSHAYVQITILCLNIIKENFTWSLIYSNKAIRKCISLAQKIILNKSKVINDDKIYSDYEDLFNTENKYQLKNQFISQSFINEIKDKKPEIKLIKDQAIHDDIIQNFNSVHQEEKNEALQQLKSDSQVTIPCVNANSKITLDQAIASFNALINRIEETNEYSAELYSLLVVLSSFASSSIENIEAMCKEGIIDNIIILIEHEHMFTLKQEMGYHLFNELIDHQFTIQSILSNENIYPFFLKEMHKLSRTCSENISLHLKPKLKAITKLMSKLTDSPAFVKNSYSYFINDTCQALSTISSEPEIIINLLITLNHLLASFEDYSSHTNTLSHILATVIWNNYSHEITVLIEIMNVIEFLHDNKAFITGIVEHNIVVSLLEILSKGNRNNSNKGFIRIFTLMNLISYHHPFTDEMITKGKEILIASSVKNISDPNMIINSLQFVNTAILQNNKAISMLTTTTINDFLVIALSQYMNTDNIDIIINVFTLILKLLSEHKNKKYYIDDTIFSLLLQIASIYNSNMSIVSMAYDCFDIILDPKLQYQKQCSAEPVVEDNTKKNKVSASKFSSNLNELEDNLKKVFEIFFEDIELITKFLNVIKQICRQDIDIEIKRRFLGVLLDTLALSFSIEKIKQVELFIGSILQISEIEKEILLTKDDRCLQLLNQLIQSISIDYISDLLSKAILQLCITIIKLETKDNIAFIPSIVTILLWIKDNHQLHTDDNILKMSLIIKTLCNFDMNFFINNKNNSCCLFYFILNTIRNLNPLTGLFDEVIEHFKKISLYYQIQSDANGNEIAEILYHFYRDSYKQKNVASLVNILQIVSNLCRCSAVFKKQLNTAERNLSKDLEEFINENCFNDKLLTYQAKGALMLLNVNLIALEKNIAYNFIEEEEEDDIEIKGEIKQFLNEKKRVKLYTEEGCYEGVVLQMDQKMEKIMVSNLPNREYKEILIKDMDSCVRSCSANLFKTKLFAKKPKAAHCFSIIIMKNIKYIKNLNVECEEEETCVKYVDYVSMIIHKYKSKKNDYFDS